MKKLLLLLIIPFLSFGQVVQDNPDTALELQAAKITELENDLEYLKHQLNRHHNQYSFGIGMQLVGGVIMATSGSSRSALGVGGVISVLGGVVMLSSDRFFGKRHTNRANKNKRRSEVKSSDDFKPLIQKLKE